jgi:glyoxylase-like metal-dependent hydrolase (beta-lactamase superfamily II)
MKVAVNKLNTRFNEFSNWGYIVENLDTSSAIVIDPAWDFDIFIKKLEEYKTKVEAVFLTHSHLDHTNLVKEFVEKYDVQVYMSRKEKEFYQFNCKNLNLLEMNQNIIVKGMKVECYMTPGHTKGSMCYFIHGNLFTGDTVFNEGCGLCNTKGGSAEEMYYSIKFIKNNFLPDIRIFPGHTYGKPVGQTLQNVEKDNIYFNINEIKQFVDFRMRKNQKNLFDFI